MHLHHASAPCQKLTLVQQIITWMNANANANANATGNHTCNTQTLKQIQQKRQATQISELENLVNVMFRESIPQHLHETLFNTSLAVSLLPGDHNNKTNAVSSIEIPHEQQQKLKRLCKKDPILHPQLAWNFLHEFLLSKLQSHSSSDKKNIIYYVYRAFEISNILFHRSHSFRSVIDIPWLFSTITTIKDNPHSKSHPLYDSLMILVVYFHSIWSKITSLTPTMKVYLSTIKTTIIDPLSTEISEVSQNTDSSPTPLIQNQNRNLSDNEPSHDNTTHNTQLLRVQIQYIIQQIPQYSTTIQELADRISACLLIIFPKKNFQDPILYGPIAVNISSPASGVHTGNNSVQHPPKTIPTSPISKNSLAEMLKTPENQHLYPIVSSSLYHLLHTFYPKVIFWRKTLPTFHYLYSQVDSLYKQVYKSITVAKSLGFQPVLLSENIDNLLDCDLNFDNLSIQEISKNPIEEATDSELSELPEYVGGNHSLSSLLPKLPNISQVSWPKMPKQRETKTTPSLPKSSEIIQASTKSKNMSQTQTQTRDSNPPDTSDTNSHLTKLYSEAPILKPGSWQYYWEVDFAPANPSGIERNHRFLGSANEEAMINIRKDPMFASMVNPSMELEPSKPVPLKTCGAPLSGKFGRFTCPRQHARTCPFHGVIIPRDEAGYPIDSPTEHTQRSIRPRQEGGMEAQGPGQAPLLKILKHIPPPAKRKKFNSVNSSLALTVKKLHSEAMDIKRDRMKNVKYTNSFFDIEDGGE